MWTPGRQFFGIYSAGFYSRLDATPYGLMKILKSTSLSFSGKLVELNGGASKYPWAVEEGPISSQLGLKFSEYPDFAFQLFGGATPTENGADALGAVSTLTNKMGTSLMNATTGIASVAVNTGSEGDLKAGKYVVKAISATTVNIYALSDIDFGRGTLENFQDSTLVLLANAISITTGATSIVSGFGFKFTGGSGTIGLITGDTATFEVRPKNTANAIMTLGSTTSLFPEFGCLLYGKKRGTGELVEIDLPRVKAEGVPIGLDEDKWSECDIKATVMYDPALDYVARLRFITPTTPT